MRFSRNPYKSLRLVLLALLLAFVSETTAWWWDSQTPRTTLLPGTTWLGLGAGLLALTVGALLWRQLSAAKLEARQAHQLLASCLDTLDVGLEIWDERDRLVLFNKKINLIYSGFHTPADIGQSFEALLRTKLKRHLIPAAVGSEQKWLEQRLASRGRHKEHVLKALTGKQRLAQQTNMDELTCLANR